VLSRDQLVALQERAERVRVEPKMADYMLAIADSTRGGGDFLLGISTRAVQSLYRAAQAMALVEGRDFVVPDDVQRLAPSVLAHRVVLKRGVGNLDASRDAVRRVVEKVPVPV